MNRIVIVVLLFWTVGLQAQKKMSWSQLCGAEKIWVLLHPFSAVKAKSLTRLAVHKSDSVHKELEFSNPKSGGQLDALRHSFWMALIAYEIGPKRAIWLGNAHEKAGIKNFENGKVEDGSWVDKATKDMDDFNNVFGVKIGKYCYDCTQEKLLQITLEALEKGELRIIKQDGEGNSLNENGEIIPVDQWKGNWENERLLMPSRIGL